MRIAITLKTLSISKLGILGIVVLVLIFAFRDFFKLESPILFFLLLIFVIIAFMRQSYIIFHSTKRTHEKSIMAIKLLSLEYKEEGSHIYVSGKIKLNMKIVSLGPTTLVIFKNLDTKSNQETYLKNTILKYQYTS